MRLLFCVPPAAYNPEGTPDRLYGCSYGYDYKPPLHLLLLATIARDAGHEARLLDAPAEGWSAPRFERYLRGERFDAAVFFTVYVSSDMDLRAADFIQDLRPETAVVWTGAAPSWKPRDFLARPRRFVLKGEPEIGFARLLSNGLAPGPADVPGLAWLEGGLARENFRSEFLDVSALPIPDRRLLLGKYRVNRLNVFPVTAAAFSRGCAFKCKFCAPMGLDQAIEVEFKKEQEVYRKRPPLRVRPADLVIREMEEIAALGIRGVEVCDNVFSWERERTLAICEGIRPLGLEWICLNRAPTMHDEEVVAAMARAGCRMVYMGTESFSDDILKDCEKKHPVSAIARAVEVLKKHGIEPEISVLLGASPRETEESAAASIRAARKLRTRFLHYGMITPFPNTEYYDEMRANGWLTEPDYRPVDMLKESLVRLPHLSGARMRALMKRAYRRQYLEPRRVWEHVKRVRSPGDLLHKARMLFKFLRYLLDPRGRAARENGGPSDRPRPNARRAQAGTSCS